MGIVDVAIEYARKGLFVFPVNVNKTPLAGTSGFKDATIDEAEIKKMWENHPDAGLAIATGPSKLTVIDIDIKHGVDVDEFLESLEAIGILPETVRTITPSGGAHLIFRNDDNGEITSKTNALIEGVDTRSQSGYIVAPPTPGYRFFDEYTDILDRGVIEQIPKWLHNHIKKQIGDAKKTPAIDTALDTSLMTMDPQEVSSVRSALAFIPDVDDRDTWLKIGMALKTTMTKQAYALWCEWSQQSAKYDSQDQKKTWDYVSDFGDCTIGTLYHIAKQNGWQRISASPIQNLLLEPKKEIVEAEKKEIAPKPSFPKELLNVPGLLGDIKDYILSQVIKSQPVFALAAAITACGTIMGRKVQTETGLRTNIYAMGVGEAGCGKEAPRQIIKKIFNAANVYNKCAVEDIASDTSIITALEGTPSSLFLLDEIGQFISNTQGASNTPYLARIKSLLMRLYGAANGPFSGKIYADKDKNTTIQQPNLSIYGTTVPCTLYESMNMGQVTDGFLSRLLVFETAENDPRRQKIKIKGVPETIIKKISEWGQVGINKYAPGNIERITIPSPVFVPCSDEAREYFDNFEEDLRSYRGELRASDRPGVLYIRTSAQAEQLALIRACSSDYDRAIISLEDAKWACKLAKYLADNMLYIVENYVSDNQIESNTKRMLNHIKANPEGVSKTMLTRKNHRIKKNEREEILKTLLESGQIECREKINEETKRKTVFFICTGN
jgi:hypothetical protein